jgi:carboxyl-terminal processing protease
MTGRFATLLTSSKAWRVVPVLLTLVLGACSSLPNANERRIPEVAAVADASPERLALNAQVYDLVVQEVAERHYQRAELASHFLEQAAGKRTQVIASVDEVGFYTGLNAVLADLGDKHTNATRPRSNRLTRQRRLGEGLDFGFSLAGVGGGGGYVVDRVRADGPAAEAGVRPGWRVDTVDGLPFSPAGSYIDGVHVWGFTDAGYHAQSASFAAVPLPREVGYLERTPEGVAVITFNLFDAPTRQWLQARLAELQADPPPGIIVDLRGNGGGDAAELRRILSPFFAAPTPYGIYDSGPIFGGVRKTRRWRTPWTGPLAVLISGRTASAAELFAAAIQENHRGPVAGSKSAGAVVASRHFDLPDGGMLSVGVSAFRTASGATLEHVGVTPDIVTAPTIEDLRANRDLTLDAAVAALLTPKAAGTVAKSEPRLEPA